MELSAYFPFWDLLTKEERALLEESAYRCNYEKGTVIHGGSLDCMGLFLVTQGQLRVYTVSEGGKELTLYRLFDRDLCLLSASCVIRGIQFDVTVETVEDTKAIHIPTEVYQKLMEESLAVASYTNELMASRFSEVMWLLEQMMSQKLDSRLAAFLLEERNLRGTRDIALTHEQMANHLGSAREVVTRMLKHFQSEGLVLLGRGKVSLLDEARLQILSKR